MNVLGFVIRGDASQGKQAIDDVKRSAEGVKSTFEGAAGGADSFARSLAGGVAGGLLAARSIEEVATAIAGLTREMLASAVASESLQVAYANFAGTSVQGAAALQESFRGFGLGVNSAEELLRALQPVAGILSDASRGAVSYTDAVTVMASAQKLAVETGSGLEESTRAVVAVMRTFGESVGDSSHIEQALYESSRLTGTSVAEVGQAVDTLHLRLRQFNPDMDTLNTLLVGAAEAGSSGSRQLLMVANSINSLAKPTKEQAQALYDMGVGLYDVEGKLRPLPDILDDIGQKLSKMSPAQAMDVEHALGIQGYKELYSIIGQGGTIREREIKLLEDESQHQLDAAKSADTLSGVLKSWAAAAHNAGEAIGQALIQALLNFVVAGDKAILKFEEFVATIGGGLQKLGTPGSAVSAIGAGLVDWATNIAKPETEKDIAEAEKWANTWERASASVTNTFIAGVIARSAAAVAGREKLAPYDPGVVAKPQPSDAEVKKAQDEAIARQKRVDDEMSKSRIASIQGDNEAAQAHKAAADAIASGDDAMAEAILRNFDEVKAGREQAIKDIKALQDAEKARHDAVIAQASDERSARGFELTNQQTQANPDIIPNVRAGLNDAANAVRAVEADIIGLDQLLQRTDLTPADREAFTAWKQERVKDLGEATAAYQELATVANLPTERQKNIDVQSAGLTLQSDKLAEIAAKEAAALAPERDRLANITRQNALISDQAALLENRIQRGSLDLAASGQTPETNPVYLGLKLAHTEMDAIVTANDKLNMSGATTSTDPIYLRLKMAKDAADLNVLAGTGSQKDAAEAAKQLQIQGLNLALKKDSADIADAGLNTEKARLAVEERITNAQMQSAATMKEIENLPLTQELAKVRVQENDANYQKALAQQALDRKQAEFTVNTTIETRIALLRSELSIQEAITSQARARGEVTQEQYTGRLGSSGITPNQISNGTAGSTAGGNSAVSGSSVLGQLTAGVPGGSVLDQLTGSAKGVPGAGPSMFDPKFAAMVYEMVNGQVTKVPYEQARREYYSTGDPNRNFIFFPASPLNPATMSAQQTETQRLATYLGPGGANKVTLTPQEVKDLAGYAQPPQKQALNVTVTLNGSDIGKAAADEIYDGLNLQVGTAP